MNKQAPYAIEKILLSLVFVALCGIFISAQDLKSRPQGSGLVTLNGAFDIPKSVPQGFAPQDSISAAIADVDLDGVNDLILGHSNSVSIQRGDINAFAPKTPEAFAAIRDLRFISPFRSESRVFALPFAAEFIQVGDFTRDGRMDIVVGARAADRIVLLEGNRRGDYTPREIFVGGEITAMGGGDANRPDGFADILIGVGTELLTYTGTGDIFNFAPRRAQLPHRIETIGVGQLDAGDMIDIAVGGENQISILSGGADNNEISTMVQNFRIRSLIVGDFVPDRAYRPEIAALDEAGAIHVLTRGDLDTRPVTADEQLAVQVREMQAKNWPVPERMLQKLRNSGFRELDPFVEKDNKTWSEYDQFSSAEPDALALSNAVLTSGRLSNYGEDLIVLDRAGGEIVVMPLVFDPETSDPVSYVGRRETVRFKTGGSPVAALVGRLNFDGDKDLLVIKDGTIQPAALVTAPQASFTVNNNGDAVDSNPGNGLCATAGGVCTLRAAIMEANRLAGNDSITINAGLNITLNTGKADNDTIGENSATYGDLDIFCAINAAEDTCNAPLNTNNNDLSITGSSNVISSGTFAASSGTGVTTDRVFDIGMDGVFGGGFGGSTGLDITISGVTLQNGNVRQDRNDGVGAANFARGGAIRMDGFGQSGTRGSLTLTSVTLNNNQADHDSGGVFNQYSSVSFSSVTATTNIGKAGPGGALQYLSSSPATLSITNSSFTSNEARTGPVFDTTATDVDGGAVAANSDTNTVTVSTTNFSNNISFDDGGALKVFNGAATVTGGTMSGNTSRDDGGAVWGDIDTVGASRFLTLSGVTIQGNTANSDSSGGGDGGAVFRDRGTLNVTNCTIGGLGGGQPNNAVNGGGIAHAFRAGASPSNVTAITINNGAITGNNATTNGGGLNINATNAASATTLTVGDTTNVNLFENNANIHGGGLAVTANVTTNMVRGTLHGNDADKDNNASGDGGAIYHAGTGGQLTISSTSTIGTSGQANTGENGGAIHHSAGALILNGPGISSNTTDIHGGGLFVSGGTATVNGVTFASNTSTSGTEVRLTGGTTTFTNAITIPGELSISGGTLNAGTSTVFLSEDFHFDSGTFTAGTSLFNFNGTGAQKIYGASAATFSSLTNSNVAQPLIVNTNMSANGTLSLNANTILSPLPTVVIGGAGTLTGSGNVRVTRTAATADLSSQYTITNKTLTNLTVHYLGTAAQVVSALTYGGLTINNASGVTLATGTTTVGGLLSLESGNLSVGTNTLSINAGTNVTGGTFSTAATGTVNYNQASNGQSVLLANYGNLGFSNFNKTVPPGTIGIAGTFTPGTGSHTVTGTTFVFNGAGAQTIPNTSYVNVSTGGSGVKTTGSAVNVSGNVTVANGTTLSVPASGTLTIGGTLTNNGTVQGSGTIANNFTNTGTVGPGLSPGILSVTGNYTNAGTLSIEIGGTAGPGVNPNGHDQLAVSGLATMGGNLTVTLTNGFIPAPGNSFTFVDGGTSTGTFATATLPNIFPNVWAMLRNEAAGTFTLVVRSPTAASVSVSGRVLSANGNGIRNAWVMATDLNGSVVTARTNSFGNYRIDGLQSGQTYTIGAEAKSHRFTPRVISLTDNVTDLDFVSQATGNR